MYFLLSACQNPDILRPIYFIKMIIDIICTIMPVVLIVYIIIDLLKAIVAKNDEDMHKITNTAVKRIFNSILIFFVPLMVNLVNDMLGSMGVNYAECFTNANSTSIASFEIIKEQEDAELEKGYKAFLASKLEAAKAQTFEREKNLYHGIASDNFGSVSSSELKNSGGIYNSMADAMMDTALKEVGYTETGDNNNKFGASFNVNNQPWCAIFVRWVMQNTTYHDKNLLKDVVEKDGGTVLPYSAINYINTFSNNNGLSFEYSQNYGGKYIPKKGDLIFFWWSKDWNKSIYKNMHYTNSHIGIVCSTDSTKVYTVEGNTGNPGSVAKRSYALSDAAIMGYGSWYTK